MNIANNRSGDSTAIFRGLGDFRQCTKSKDARIKWTPFFWFLIPRQKSEQYGTNLRFSGCWCNLEQWKWNWKPGWWACILLFHLPTVRSVTDILCTNLKKGEFQNSKTDVNHIAPAPVLSSVFLDASVATRVHGRLLFCFAFHIDFRKTAFDWSPFSATTCSKDVIC